MAKKLLNRVRMSVIGSAGTGTLTLNLQAAGFQDLVGGGMVDGDTTPYVLEDGSPIGTVWEIGLGTYRSNGTFERTTVTQSSAGGITKISATSTAILSATLRAVDLSGVTTLAALEDVDLTGLSDGKSLVYDATSGLWKPRAASSAPTTPTIVQYKTIQQESVGAVNVTLNSAPTSGNHLLAIGSGGGSAFRGIYTPGFSTPWSDIGDGDGLNSQYYCDWAVRAMRSGDGQTWGLGSVSTGYPFGGVLVEIAGLDINKNWYWSTGVFASTTTSVEALADVNALTLAFMMTTDLNIYVDTFAGTIDVNNHDGTTRLVYGHDVAAAGWNGIAGHSPSSNHRVLVFNLPGT